MPAEAANAWWKKVRRGEMSASDLDEAIVSLLGGDHVRADPAVLVDDGRAGVVAARLEREYHADALGVDSVSAVRHMITASSPVSW